MKRLAFLSAATLAAASAAQADTVVGLVGERTLALIDMESAAVTRTIEIAGAGPIVGIDWRPGDGMLYAATEAGELLRIDLEGGAAEIAATTDTVLPVTGPVAMDFNPMADRLRLMSGTVNHRIHPDTGETTVDGDLHFDEASPEAGSMPGVVATAYINSRGTPETTAQYNIDAARGALLQQTAPNDGTLAVVGPLGIPESEHYAFDIATDAEGTNTGWLAAGGMLYTVSLEDGSATGSRPIAGAPGPVRDLTVVPAM